MGVITPDRFNPIKAYCNVRLQQGVPLVDADVNELDDIRKFEVRAFLKWFVGNGIPDGNDGFHIAALAAPSATDFQIQVGAQLPAGPIPTPPSVATNEFVLDGFGRCIVDGLDVIIQASTSYTAQVLSPVDLAPPYSLPPVAAIPSIAGPVLVYLDIWERLVAPTEDPALIVPPLGTESCARTKRQWVVRTVAGTTTPAPATINGVRHVYYGLAVITRPIGALIQAATITDVRDRGLSLTPSTLVPDVLGGTTSAYRQGLGRPAVSLRDALNAVARGEVPALPEHPVNAVPTSTIEAFGRPTLDRNNGLFVTWLGLVSTPQIYVARLDFGNPGAGFGPATQITTGLGHQYPSTGCLLNGDLVVAYQNSASNVYFRRGPTPAALAAATEQQVTTTGNTSYPFIVTSNNIVVFFFTIAGVYQYQRYNAATNAYLDATPVALAGANSSGNLHAAVDSAGYVWGAYATTTAPAGLRTFRLNPTTGVIDTQGSSASASGDTYGAPFVLCGAGQVWAFWSGNGGVWFASYNGSAWGIATRLPYTIAGDTHPIATFDAQSQIALAYDRPLPPAGAPPNIVLAHGDPAGGGWLPPMVSSVTSSADTLWFGGPYAGGLFLGAGALWQCWTRISPSAYRLYYRQLCSPL
jgi:hypothetical protein